MALARSFSKLNGHEIGKILLADLETAIARDGAFAQNVTYLEFEFNVDIVCKFVAGVNEPQQEAPIRINGGRTMVEAVPESRTGEVRSLVPPEATRGVLEVTRSKRHSSVDEPPDKVRKEAGVFIPKPQMTKTGEIVDIPLEETNKDVTLRARRAAQQRDREVAEKGLGPIIAEARPVQELAQDVTETPVVEVQRELNHVEREPTVIDRPDAEAVQQ
jgi:hypothetical protein